MADRRVDEFRGRAMGSQLHLLVVCDPALDRDPVAILRACRSEIVRLEGLWSRFDPTSDISVLNRSCGPQLVAPETADLLIRAIEAWHRTDGRFDPTLHDDLVGSGYDRDFATITDRPLQPIPGGRRRPLGQAGSMCGRIEIDRTTGTVTLPPRTAIDAGGLGKGLAADRVTDLALRLGASGAMVNLGGDLRCRGRAPDPGGWVIGTRAAPGQPSRTVVLGRGGVATSSCLRRRWPTSSNWSPDEWAATGLATAHHLLDASTGQSRPQAARQVTVVAATASDAETVATAIASSDLADDPAAPELTRLLGAAGALIVDHRGTTHLAGSIDEVLR